MTDHRVHIRAAMIGMDDEPGVTGLRVEVWPLSPADVNAALHVISIAVRQFLLDRDIADWPMQDMTDHSGRMQ